MIDNPFRGVSGPFGFPNLADFGVSGIYFLHLDGEVVYVGQAVDMRRRIGQHLGDASKRFDAVSFVQCDVQRLDTLERHYIHKLSPRYNRCGLANGVRKASELSGVSFNQPRIDEEFDEEGAARFLGLSVEEFRYRRRTAKWLRPFPARRGRGTKVMRYRIAHLRAFAIQHLSNNA